MSKSGFEIKDNSGHLFRNKKKEKEIQPDFKGDVVVGGEKYQIAAWTKVDKNGEKFLSLKFSEPFTPDPAFRKPARDRTTDWRSRQEDAF